MGDTIGRANLDGAGANQSFIAGAHVPCGVAVDGAHIYWANGDDGTIGRANLDGSRADQSFITGGNRPCGVAVDGGHIYWANGDDGTIGRANLDGTGANQGFISGATAPCGVAVDALRIAIASDDDLAQCRNGRWAQFGFKSQGRCVAFVVLTRICDALERHGIHLKFCPPTPPRPAPPELSATSAPFLGPGRYCAGDVAGERGDGEALL